MQRRPWGGYDDPALPEGIWVVLAIVTGNGSGGIMQVNIVFQQFEAARLGSEMFSIEQLSCQTSVNVTEQCQVETFNMGPLPSNPKWLLFIEDGGAGVNSSSSRANAIAYNGLFLDGPILPAQTAALSLTVANADPKVMLVSAEGYIWGARSRSLPGGPRQPPNGLYGPR